MSFQYVDGPMASPRALYVSASGSVLQVMVMITGVLSTGPPLSTTFATSTVKAGYVVLGAPLPGPASADTCASAPPAPASAVGFTPLSTGVVTTPPSAPASLPSSLTDWVAPPHAAPVPRSASTAAPAPMRSVRAAKVNDVFGSIWFAIMVGLRSKRAHHIDRTRRVSMNPNTRS